MYWLKLTYHHGGGHMALTVLYIFWGTECPTESQCEDALQENASPYWHDWYGDAVEITTENLPPEVREEKIRVFRNNLSFAKDMLKELGALDE